MEERHQRDIQALYAKIDKLFIALPRPIVERPIRYITDEEEQQIQEEETDPYEEVTHMTYIQGGYNKGYNSYKPPHSNLSYKNNNVVNPHDQVYPQSQQQP